MDTSLYSLLSRLENNPEDRLAWQQVKRRIKQKPEETFCSLFFGHLAAAGWENAVIAVLIDHWPEIFNELLLFYKTFLERTRNYGDIWGGGKEFWFIVQFLEIFSQSVHAQLIPRKQAALNQILADLRTVTGERAVLAQPVELGLSFLPQEVALNLELYLKPAVILADYPEFRHMYFLPCEISPLACDLENYHLSPHSERYLENLLHETRRKAFRTNLLYFAQTFPLVLQAKWAYALYISLEAENLGGHPFVRRLLANSYWEARAGGYEFSSGIAEKRPPS